MKLSQNNWEKSIGEKLRHATSTPEGHVWDLLEMELNAQNLADKRKTYKIATAIVALLLISIAIIPIWNSNNAELASFPVSLNLPNQIENNLFAISKESSTNSSLISNYEIKSSKINSEFDKSVNRKVKDIPRKSAEKFAEIKEAVQKVDDFSFGNIKSIRDAETINVIAISKDEDKIILNQSLAEIETYDIDEEFTFNNLPQRIKEFKSLNLNDVSNQYTVSNNVAKFENETNLMAYQQINLLNVNSQSVIKSNKIYSDSKLILNNSRKANALDLCIILEDNMEIAMLDNATELNWMESANEELQNWQKNLDSKNEIAIPKDIDDDIVEELIEEAELDKDDPLSLMKEAADRLYYAKSINKGFHIGIVSGVQNSWITKSSRNPEVSRQFSKYKFSPGYQVGINVGYDFAKHFGVMAEFKYSDEGVKYKNTLTDKSEHLDLKYIEIPIFLKAKHSMLTPKMKPIVFNYLLGVNYSDLRSVEAYVDEEVKRFAQDYNTSEWGITAGFDFDYYFNNNLFITVGTRGSVNGFSNNFAKAANDNSGSTTSYNIGLYTRINFRLPGR